ncbi:hypothetical protein [Kitasatospora aureofaciens]|uniref:hypothetical protein n=1 Tax=Kitasatospora aureofaciens TaxID=1894 RepID=UPI00069249CC|nr:hypothetical protein [Kitasatospora aureofaciens]
MAAAHERLARRDTAGQGDDRHRLRAFIERHRPGVGDEQTAAQLAACAQVWEQTGEDGARRAWERRRRSFPRLLVVLVGTAAAGVRGAVADLRLAAEENPAVAEMLAAVPAGAARIEDLVQRGPSAPVWHPLSSSRHAGGRGGGRGAGRRAGTAAGRAVV